MSFSYLRRALDPRHAILVDDWRKLFGLQQRHLLTQLGEELRASAEADPEDRDTVAKEAARHQAQANLSEFRDWVAQRFVPSTAEYQQVVRLYAEVAARLPGFETVDDLVREFGVGPVADVKAELEGISKIELPYPEVRLGKLALSERYAVWPWETRIAAQAVTVPLVKVWASSGQVNPKREGLAASFRFEWVEREEAVGKGHVYLAPAQMQVRRTAPFRPPDWYKESAWWESELTILDYLTERLTSSPVERPFHKWPTPYALPLSPAKERRPAGRFVLKADSRGE